VKGAIKIFFGLLFSALMLFMPKTELSTESVKEKNFISCCKYQDVVDKCCEKHSHEKYKCEGDCLVNCCCSEIELKNEKSLNIEVAIFQYPKQSLDIYDTKYKYLFHYTIYKPPINFIS